MNYFSEDNNQEWQDEVRSKIEDLSSTLSLSNNKWNAWELEFIESISEKLEQKTINVSPKQYEIIWNLWDKM